MKDPRAIANSSGFPLQIRIAHVINKSQNWRVIREEYPWSSIESGLEGFIDIVALRQTGRHAMVIECKRVKETTWVFLIPKENPSSRSRFEVWESHWKNPKWEIFGWANCEAEPLSFESEFCAIDGQEGGRGNLLERTAGILSSSVEALADQERILAADRGEEIFSRIYSPIIVTTANIAVSCFDPSSISLSDGCLPEKTIFQTVPYVRFRKTLTSHKQPGYAKAPFQMPGASERVIFVINAESFPKFLQEYEII